jgi:signal transduction histidine kinase
VSRHVRAVDASAAPAEPLDAAASLQTWRSRILQRLLVTTAVVAAVAYVPGVLAAADAGLYGLIVIDTIAWAAVIALAAWRRLPFSIRANAFLIIWYSFALVLLWLVGPAGAGIAWLLSVPVLSALFFGRPGALWGVISVVLVGVAFGALLFVAPGAGAVAVPEPPYSLMAWIASAGSVIFLSVVLAVGIAHVITGIVRSAEALRTANDRLVAALADRERLEQELVRTAKTRALGRLASGVAHDLNNLLVPILVAGGEARDAAREGTRQRQRLELVVAAAERARDLSQRILTFGRDAPTDRRPIAVVPLVHEVVDLVRGALPETVTVHASVGDGDPHVLAEPGEIHQVLMNLCTNAARALEESGGTIDVRAGVDEGAAELVIVVQDDGPGIAPEDLERVFEPYHTSRKSSEGTGLGLAIVRHLADGLGGSVSLSSSGGEGAVATLRLPLASPPHGSPLVDDSPAPRHSGR